MSRAALAILSTENLLNNIEVIKQRAPHAQFMGIVKANAYGHGIRSVSLRIAPHVASFGVASIDEALILRKIGIKKPITLLEGVFEPDELLVAACEHLHVVFHDAIQLEWLRTASLPLPLTAWIKIDTGLGRLGFTKEQMPHAYAELFRNPLIHKPIGLMSHFSCADQESHPLNEQQITLFNELTSLYPNGPKSLCNSAGIFRFPQHHHAVIRPGIALYGVSPLEHYSALDLSLKPVMSLQTRLMAVRNVSAGTTIGYGARFVCPEPMRIGVAAIGYGDGYPRTAQDGTPVLVNGVRCHLVGRTSMDMITIDLRPCPHAKVGDPVILWGESLALEEVAPFTGHIPYDLLTAVQARVRFHWTLAT